MENAEFCDSLARSSSTQSKAMAAPAASLLSLRFPSSPFKLTGKLDRPKACNFTRLKLHSNKKRPLVISSTRQQQRQLLCLLNLQERGSGWTIWARNRGLERKERGVPAAQGNSCGLGMRGQKSRSGPGARKGFEGGQMPLYSRVPNLRGIAGGGAYVQ